MPRRKRELITSGFRKLDPGRPVRRDSGKGMDAAPEKRYIRRDAKGRFDDVVDVGRSLSQDREPPAKTVAEAPVHLPRPVKSPIDYDALITKTMTRFPNIRAHLAK